MWSLRVGAADWHTLTRAPGVACTMEQACLPHCVTQQVVFSAESTAIQCQDSVVLDPYVTHQNNSQYHVKIKCMTLDFRSVCLTVIIPLYDLFI